MRLTVFVEPTSDGNFVASTSQPIFLQSRASSPDKAVQELQKLAEERLAGGKCLDVTIATNSEKIPWLKFAGIWKDHPDIEDYLDNVSQYRVSSNETSAS